GRVKESFGALSLDALSKNTEEFLKLANERLSKQTESGEKELDGKKKLIDQTLEAMKTDLKGIQDLVVTLEKDREKKFGELSSQLKSASEQTIKLQETAHQLKVALSSTKARGQWGERMAEDVLRLAGFVEGINYRKQKALETAATRPDYTFFLPQDLKVNMDVKFPLDNYLRYLESENDTERERNKNRFLKDVRERIKEVLTRDYINPEENTVDYVIVFIPNEQVYAFINENDATILDEALKNKVILCSPITLYAILAVIRQAVDNFNLEKTAAQILSLLGTFYKQWDSFIRSFDKMGKRIEDVQKEFNHLTSTRRNQLEKPLRKIEDLRRQKGMDDVELAGYDTSFIDVENGADETP
ncbi:MAG: DNA recombination protein RmuC, partial [Thermodesulfobacteriota bacterium]|nr:DNA recombination protein RmuC [Thermodesulfobacteriota bacterium]